MKCEKCGSSDVTLLFTGYVCNVCDPVPSEGPTIQGKCDERTAKMVNSRTSDTMRVPYNQVKHYMENGWFFCDMEELDRVVKEVGDLTYLVVWVLTSAAVSRMLPRNPADRSKAWTFEFKRESSSIVQLATYDPDFEEG